MIKGSYTKNEHRNVYQLEVQIQLETQTEKPNQDEFFNNSLLSVNSPSEINTKTTHSPYHLHLSFDGCGLGTGV